MSHSNIINIIDQKVLNFNPRFFSYTLAKTSLWNFTKLAAQELGPKIRVNAIGPGPILKASHQSEAQFQNQRKSTLLNRGSDVEEISGTHGYSDFIISEYFLDNLIYSSTEGTCFL